MAVGVPENEVFAAADAVLARGERPTVERVRLELGRGSPARVGGLLDQWWASLAERLSSETRLPTLPAGVSQAFVAVWQQAIHLAQAVAEQGLSEQRQVVTAERERVAVVEDQARQDAALARQHAMVAQAAQQVSETRLADLEALLEQRATQILDLQQQRDSLLRERGDGQQHSQTLHQELNDLRRKAEQERVAQEIYVRGVEDRAHREVDRAREESKHMTAQVKEAGYQLEHLQQRLEGAQDALGQALQNAAAQLARGDTLEQQLVQLRSLPVSERKTRARKKPVPSPAK
ncbi:DNA-binding protein [Pseudomonas deceptionensis]|uniref:Replication region DNA-binding N-term n=1 Tax=Pseudomonas deceptionensis TaxID=882211 RepID=A0A0J6G651_PSEDM|nr:DNA-binding protein [Pseudomonas deceptionensis]KMM77958.1 plasmid replication region [Pseudomonas deceptionensis]SEE97593.1 replication region DNA-binding N-term [Pseudomonas deceptionensis]